MNSLQRYAFAAARVLVAGIFLASGFGIIPQALAVKELVDHGIPAALVPLLMLAARAIEILGGFGMILYSSSDCGNRVDRLLGSSDARRPCLLAGRGNPCLYPTVSQFPEERCNDERPVVHRSNA